MGRGDQVVEVAITLSFKGKLAEKHSVHENATGPNVGRWALVWALLYDFGRHVGWGTAVYSQESLLFKSTTEPKVNQLKLSFLIHDDVLKLDISMRNLFRVKVSQHGHELSRNLLDVVFGQPSFLLGFQMGEKRFAFDLFKDQTHAGRGFYGFMQTHDPRVVQVR
jgi:hypothetical protein